MVEQRRNGKNCMCVIVQLFLFFIFGFLCPPPERSSAPPPVCFSIPSYVSGLVEPTIWKRRFGGRTVSCVVDHRRSESHGVQLLSYYHWLEIVFSRCTRHVVLGPVGTTIEFSEPTNTYIRVLFKTLVPGLSVAMGYWFTHQQTTSVSELVSNLSKMRKEE